MMRKGNYYTYCRTHRQDGRISMAKKYREEAEKTRDIDTLLTVGNKAQAEKLEKYNYKKDWLDMSFDEIASLIYEESEEVHEELIKRVTDWEALRLECADLANACHMMILMCDNLRGGGGGNK